MSQITTSLQRVQERIDAAARAAGRGPGAVSLLAVSKTFPAGDVRAAHAAGQNAFGENYVQEAVEKMAELADLRDRLTWHFIGPLQSNKTRPVAERFDWVHTVDRLKVATRLSEQRPAAMAPLNVCVQVNISGEASKHGVAPGEALALLHDVAALPGLRLRGLMAIPAAIPAVSPAIPPAAASVPAPESMRDSAPHGAPVAPRHATDAQREPHRALYTLFEAARTAGLALDTLSAGMSDDLEAAVLEGATLVRIGSAIFGRRDYGDSPSLQHSRNPL